MCGSRRGAPGRGWWWRRRPGQGPPAGELSRPAGGPPLGRGPDSVKLLPRARVDLARGSVLRRCPDALAHGLAPPAATRSAPSPFRDPLPTSPRSPGRAARNCNFPKASAALGRCGDGLAGRSPCGQPSCPPRKLCGAVTRLPAAVPACPPAELGLGDPPFSARISSPGSLSLFPGLELPCTHGSRLQSPRLLSARQMGRAVLRLDRCLLELAGCRQLVNLSFR